MLKHCRWILFFPVLLLLAGCSGREEPDSQEPARETEKSGKNQGRKFLGEIPGKTEG